MKKAIFPGLKKRKSDAVRLPSLDVNHPSQEERNASQQFDFLALQDIAVDSELGQGAALEVGLENDNERLYSTKDFVRQIGPVGSNQVRVVKLDSEKQKVIASILAASNRRLNLELNQRADVFDAPMVDQEDIISLTRHVRSFSDALNNLRNTFAEGADGSFKTSENQARAHSRLGEVLSILKEVLGKYPPLHSPDILTAAANIITKIKGHTYSDGDNGPPEFYAAIDQLALSFSSSVSDFLMGDKDITPPAVSTAQADHYDEEDVDENGELDNDNDSDGQQFFEPDDDEDESEKNLESEDSLEKVVDDPFSGVKGRVPGSMSPDMPVLSRVTNSRAGKSDSLRRQDELDQTLLNIEGSVDIALGRTKIWSKYAKEVLNYMEKRSHLELDFSRQLAKLAQQTRATITEESYLPFQSIFVTALDNDVQFSNNYQKIIQHNLNDDILEKLRNGQKEHDRKRSKFKDKWNKECKRLMESRANLKKAKMMYVQRQQELEKFNKQQLEGKSKDAQALFSKKRNQEEIMKGAEESEENYRSCVQDANARQQELERTKADVLLELRLLVYQCDGIMKEATISYFNMMSAQLKPLPVQYHTLAESCKSYEEGQQFAEYVRLQQSTSNQAMCPHYTFEPYRPEGSQRIGVDSLSSEDFQGPLMASTGSQPRKSSSNSGGYEHPTQLQSPATMKRVFKPAWPNQPKSSASDDTESLSSRSLNGSPSTSPVLGRKKKGTASVGDVSDEEQDLNDSVSKGNSSTLPGPFRNQKLSAAAKMHRFRKLRSPSKCKECDSYVYFNGAECEQCGLICHRKCLEKLAIKCGHKRLPRKMTTFGVDFHQHLVATKRKEIPYIIEKCISEIDKKGLTTKGLYRVSGVKSKVEKLCQQFETGGHLVDLDHIPPHFIASVLKLYLRQLPEPLLTFRQYNHFISIGKESLSLRLGEGEIESMSDDDATKYEEVIQQLHNIVKALPKPNYTTSAKLIKHLRRVADHSSENQMSAANLAIVFGPTLLRPEGDPSSLSAVMDMALQARVVELLILNSQIFMAGDEDDDYPVKVKDKEKSSSLKGRKSKEMLGDSLPVTIPEDQDDSSKEDFGKQFSQEILDIMVNSQRIVGEVSLSSKVQDKSKLGAIPGQAELDEEMENIMNELERYHERESDILNDDPPVAVPSEKRESSASAVSMDTPTTEYEPTSSRLSSVESLLSTNSNVSFGSSSPVELPDASSKDEEEEEIWLQRLGKGSIPKDRTMSNGVVEVALSGGYDPAASKVLSVGRLETTTYTFSLGSDKSKKGDSGKTDGPIVLIPVPVAAVTEIRDISVEDDLVDGDSPIWVKRRSNARAPVRRPHPKVSSSFTATDRNASALELSIDGRHGEPSSSPAISPQSQHESISAFDGLSGSPRFPAAVVKSGHLGESPPKSTAVSGAFQATEKALMANVTSGTSPSPSRGGTHHASESWDQSQGASASAVDLDMLTSASRADSYLARAGGNSSQARPSADAAESQFPNDATSPKVAPPTVLPKPRKSLDKKSWTADLIRSKQAAALDKAAHARPEEEPGVMTDDGVGLDQADLSAGQRRRSVKEILTKFESTPNVEGAEGVVANVNPTGPPAQLVRESKAEKFV